MANAGTVSYVIELIDRLSDKANRVSAALKEVDEHGQKVNTTAGALKTAFAGLSIVGAYMALERTVAVFADFAKTGAQAERVATAFAVQLNTIGESAEQALGRLRVASRGTVSDMGLMLEANKALSLGVADSSAQIADLVKIATVLGRRTGLGQETSLERLFVGIGRLSPRILDDLGIAVNLTQLYREETGKSSMELTQQEKILLLRNKVLADGRKILAEYNGDLDDTASAYERMTAAFQNWKQQMGQNEGFEETAKFIDSITYDSIFQDIISGARESTASVEELEWAMDRLQEIREDGWNTDKAFWPGRYLGGAGNINEKILQDALAAAKSAQAVQEALNSPSLGPKEGMKDYAQIANKSAQELAQWAYRYLQIQDDLQRATDTGNGALAGKLKSDLDKIKTFIEEAGHEFNVAVEELDQPNRQIDYAAFFKTGKLEPPKDIDPGEWLSSLLENDEKALKEKQKAIEEILRNMGTQFGDLREQAANAFKSDAFDLKAGALLSGNTALADEIDRVVRSYDAVTAAIGSNIAISSDAKASQEALTLAGLAHAQMLDDLVEKYEADALRPLENMSQRVRESAAAYADGMQQVRNGGSANLGALKSDLVAAASAYNEFAKMFDKPLIDISAVEATGEIKEMTQAADVFGGVAEDNARREREWAQEIERRAEATARANEHMQALSEFRTAFSGARNAAILGGASSAEVAQIDAAQAALSELVDELVLAGQGSIDTAEATDILTRRYGELTRSLDEAARKTREFNLAQAEGDMRTAGDVLFGIQEELRKAQARLNSATNAGNAQVAAQAQADLAAIEQRARQTIAVYNLVNDPTGKSNIDADEFVRTGRIVAESAGGFDLITESQKRAQQEADELSAAQGRLRDAFERGKDPIKEFAESLSKDFATQRIDLIAKGASDEQIAQFDAVVASFEQQISTIQKATGIGDAQINRYEQMSISAEKAKIAVSGLTAEWEQQNLEQNYDIMRSSGAEIISLANELTSAMLQMNTATNATDYAAASTAVDGLRQELLELVQQYNAAAEAAGMTLIDAQQLMDGKVAAYDAAAGVDVLEAAQQQLATTARIATDALAEEVNFVYMLDSAMRGFKSSLATRIASYSDVLGVDVMNELYTSGIEKFDDLAKVIGEDLVVGSAEWFEYMSQLNSLTGDVDDIGGAARRAAAELARGGSAAEEFGKKVAQAAEAAYEKLHGMVRSGLEDAFGGLGDIGINPEELFPEMRPDAVEENARRLADIAKNGFKNQPWLEEFKNEVPGVWEELMASGDPQRAAAQMLMQFEKGMRPELLDMGLLKQQIKDKIAAEMAMDELAAQLTNELIAEIGADPTAVEGAVASVLGREVGKTSDGQVTDQVLTQLKSETFMNGMAKVASTAGKRWGDWFLGEVSTNVPQELLGLLADLLTPILQERQDREKSREGAN